ncbi:MAG: hypothetical protein ACPGVO_12315 [Spirulinaceae cyanobacterium]
MSTLTQPSLQSSAQPSTQKLSNAMRAFHAEQQLKYIDLHQEVDQLLQQMQSLKVHRQLEEIVQARLASESETLAQPEAQVV